MMRTVNFRKIFPAGTTLLEGIIAIGIIIAAVVGSLVLIMSTIKLARANQDRVVAQNLAREGIELAYSLRNSASYMRVNDATVTWDKFLMLTTQKSYATLKRFDIGVDQYGYAEMKNDERFCFYRGAQVQVWPNCQNSAGGGPIENCYSYDFDTSPEQPIWFDMLAGPLAGSAGPPEGRVNMCDSAALTRYIFDHYPLPPLCAFSETAKACDYNNDNYIDISDVVYMVQKIESESYHFVIGYPTSDNTPEGVSPNTRLVFYNGRNSMNDPTKGTYHYENAWNSPASAPRSRVLLDLGTGTYLQNIAGSTATPTKFYRVVSNQEVCRLDGSDTEIIVPIDNAFHCNDYTSTSHLVTGDPTSKKVGVLVTSEVRWPTPTSSSKAVYRELLYDWLSF